MISVTVTVMKQTVKTPIKSITLRQFQTLSPVCNYLTWLPWMLARYQETLPLSPQSFKEGLSPGLDGFQFFQVPHPRRHGQIEIQPLLSIPEKSRSMVTWTFSKKYSWLVWHVEKKKLLLFHHFLSKFI